MHPPPAIRHPSRITLFFILLLGFSSGLPLALTAGTLAVRLSDAGVDKAAIGLFAGISIAYTFKFFAAPFIDSLRLPLLTRMLGRRRAWLLLTQALLAASLIALSNADPAVAPFATAACALAVAIASALQDIVIDAYRVEILPAEDQGIGAATAVLGYRLGMIVSSAGAIYLSAYIPWRETYLIMAACVGVGLLATLLCREPEGTPPRAKSITDWMQRAVLAPLQDFLRRPEGVALPLLLVASYKLPDAFIGLMSNVYYLEAGYSKQQLAEIAKLCSILATIAGGFMGGFLVRRHGVFSCLWAGSILVGLATLLFIILQNSGANPWLLGAVVTLDNLSGGVGTTALVAYISGLCNRQFTATQYALLSSLASLARTFCTLPAGLAAKQLGWTGFFLLAAALSLPGLLMIYAAQRQHRRITH